MNRFGIENIENNIKNVLTPDLVENYRIAYTIREIEDLALIDYNELKGNVLNGQTVIGATFPPKYSHKSFLIVASRIENLILIILIGAWLPLMIISVLLGIFVSWPFLIAALLVLVAQASARRSSALVIGFGASIILAVLLPLNGTYLDGAFVGIVMISATSGVGARKLYGRIIIDRALSSELLFSYLFTSGLIWVMGPDDKIIRRYLP